MAAASCGTKSVRLSDGLDIERMLAHWLALVSPAPMSALMMLLISCVESCGI